MLDRRMNTYGEALSGLFHGATILLGGFGGAGVALGLIRAVLDSGARDLVVVSNNAGSSEDDLALLLRNGRVAKVICSFPRSKTNTVFAELHRQGKVALELVPQGTLIERIRCAGAGLGGFYTPTSAGTQIGANKESRMLNRREHVLELPLGGDFALLRALRADRHGNLVYNKSARNFQPMMATAAKITVAEVDELVDVGQLDPEAIVTPGIFVNRIVTRGSPW
ncbi:3-oxoacid CoA-transferase subunit A [Bradyrhizobium sp. 153]|uniref:3-oxoacid CoA-transferase subunit A n=1 Tax=Bradyrhizobium sp. 153 TaxID=2782627 RepID=UPI001FFA498D|nr:3-oxoacid CoA-transferase subunit A [Bradyrhizobium sp. 153]MCK1667707.1 3-oxoacid CoA-transferase subunit A [Bradyrhizobium sp. 153]